MDLSDFINEKYSRKDFEFLGSIQSTSYGKIEKTRNIKDNKEYALKIFEKFHLQDPEALEKTRREKIILSSFQNPTPFLELQDLFSDSENVYFLLEYCPHGNLSQFMQRFSKFPYELARFYAGELVKILESLRKEFIVHCEINLQTLMISSDYHLKLTNFQNALSLKTQNKLDGPKIENPEYFYPEALEGEFIPAGDI